MSTHQQPQLDLQQLSVSMGPALMVLEHNYQPPPLPRNWLQRIWDRIRDRWWRVGLYLGTYPAADRAFWRRWRDGVWRNTR